MNASESLDLIKFTFSCFLCRRFIRVLYFFRLYLNAKNYENPIANSVQWNQRMTLRAVKRAIRTMLSWTNMLYSVRDVTRHPRNDSLIVQIFHRPIFFFVVLLFSMNLSHQRQMNDKRKSNIRNYCESNNTALSRRWSLLFIDFSESQLFHEILLCFKNSANHLKSIVKFDVDMVLVDNVDLIGRPQVKWFQLLFIIYYYRWKWILYYGVEILLNMQ